MASWTVYEPPQLPAGTLAAADKAVFIRDGFSWGAFLVPFFWLLWRRMWLVFLAWSAAAVALIALTAYAALPDAVSGIIDLLFGLAFALEAQALRGWSLARKGWHFVAVACGADQAEAEYRYFDRFDVPPPVAAPSGEARPPRLSAGPRTEAVLGVFPEPHGGRS